MPRQRGATEPPIPGRPLPRGHLGRPIAAARAAVRPAVRCEAAGGCPGERPGNSARAAPAAGGPRIRAGVPRSGRRRRPAGMARRAAAGAGTARCWPRRGRALGGGREGRMGRAGRMDRTGRTPPATPMTHPRRRDLDQRSGRTAGPVPLDAPAFRTSRSPVVAAEPSAARRATVLGRNRPRGNRGSRNRLGRNRGRGNRLGRNRLGRNRPGRNRGSRNRGTGNRGTGNRRERTRRRMLRWILVVATTPTFPPGPASSPAPSDPDRPQLAEATNLHRPLRGRCRGPGGAHTHPAPTHPAGDHCFPVAARRPGHSR